MSDSVSLSSAEIDPEGVVVEAITRADDREDELVLRLYESAGRHATATVDFDVPVADAAETNLIEDRESDLDAADGSLELAFDPFEIRTVAVRLGTDESDPDA